MEKKLESVKRGAYYSKAGGLVAVAAAGTVWGEHRRLRKQHKALHETLNKLNHEEKRELYWDIMSLLGNIRWKDSNEFINYVMTHPRTRDEILEKLERYN